MKWMSVTIACAAVASCCSCAALGYPVSYLSGKLGASVSTSAKLEGKDLPNKILSDGPISRGGFVFDNIAQPQVFTVDFGQERTFDRVQLGTGRGAQNVKISISTKSADGPYEKIFEQGGLGFWQVLRLPLVTARWMRFDFGDADNGAHIHGVRIYKGYEHPKLVEVTKLLHERIKPDLPGLEKFYAAADKGDWKTACSELRAYYAREIKTEGEPSSKYDTTRGQNIVDGNLDFAGLARVDTHPIDWAYMKTTDWYEHKNFLNRGSPIGVPAVAYYHTGDKKWAKFFKDVFYDWVDENPKPEIMSGADYATWRTLDSAARLGWVTHAFKHIMTGKDIDDELWANVLFSIWEHTDYIKNDDFTGGNWLAHSSASVMGIALEYPQFKDQKIWLEYGKVSFERNVLRDIHPDGKEVEDAPGYVCFAYSAMLGTLQSLDKAGVEVDPEARRRMDRVQDYLGAVTQPDGNMPAFGDWGGGAAYPLPRAMEYFKREDIKYILTQGKEGTVPEKASMTFPDGQWSVMRSAYEERPYENARHLVFKSSSGSHGHHDILNITNYAYGRELLVDPGIRSYEHADVQRYTHTAYHNTICVDGRNQGWGGGKTEKWVSNDGLDYVLGSHTAFRGMTVRRDVLFVKPEYWIVHDDIRGEGEHIFDQNWHFKPHAGLTHDPDTKSVHTGYAEDGNLLMVPVDTQGLKSRAKRFFTATERMEGREGNMPSKGWRYSRLASGPQVFDVVMYPYSGSEVPQVSVTRLSVAGADPTDVTALRIDVAGNTDYVFVSRVGAKQVSIAAAQLDAHGQIVVVRVSGDKPVRVSGANVRKVSFRGKVLFDQEEPAAEADVILN